MFGNGTYYDKILSFTSQFGHIIEKGDVAKMRSYTKTAE